MGSFLALLYSPPVLVLAGFALSILFIIILATMQIWYTIGISILYLMSSSLFANEIIQKIVSKIHEWFPSTIQAIEENLKKTFIFHGDPSHSGLYIWHPHGLFATAPYIHNALGLGTNSPKMSQATITLFFRVPFVKEVARYTGLIDANYKTLKSELLQDKKVALVVGGIEEMFHCEKNTIKLILTKRVGYLRLALETRKPLIPVLTYGENEIYTAVKEYTNTALNRFLKANLGFILPVGSMESILNWADLHEAPLSKIDTYVGTPVMPTEEDTVETLRQKYTEALKELFDKTHPEGVTLEII